MTANLSYLPFHADADNGDPLVGGLVYTYAVGTTTPQTTWSDLAKTTPNANPVVLNARGDAQIFFDTSLKVIVKTSAGSTVQTIDNIAEGALLADTEIMALASVTSAANTLPYFTGAGTAATTSLTAFARTMLDDSDAATVLATIGAATSGHNHSATYQPLDAELTALASVTSATDSMPYFTGVGTASTTSLTTFAKTMLDDTSDTAVRSTIGAASSGHDHSATYQPLDAALTSLAGLTYTAGNIIYATGADTFAVLAPGTAGYKLESGGTGAPSWVATGGGDMLLGTTQTVTAVKKYATDTLALRGTSTGDTYLNTALDQAGPKYIVFPNHGGNAIVSPTSSTERDTSEQGFLHFGAAGDTASRLILFNNAAGTAPYGLERQPIGVDATSRLRIFASTDRNVEIGAHNGTQSGGFTSRYRFPCDSVNAAKASGTLWIEDSDLRLKENVEPANLDICYSVVKNLPLCRFSLKRTWFPDGTDDMNRVGWIADDVEAVLPKAITKSQRISLEGEVIEDCRALDSDQVMKMLYGAVQMLMAKVEALEAKNV